MSLKIFSESTIILIFWKLLFSKKILYLILRSGQRVLIQSNIIHYLLWVTALISMSITRMNIYFAKLNTNTMIQLLLMLCIVRILVTKSRFMNKHSTNLILLPNSSVKIIRFTILDSILVQLPPSPPPHPSLLLASASCLFGYNLIIC